jgi:predicted nucleotidyltransferase
LAPSEYRAWADRAKEAVDALRFHLSGYRNESERLWNVIDRAYFAIPAGDYEPSPAERVLIEFWEGESHQPSTPGSVSEAKVTMVHELAAALDRDFAQPLSPAEVWNDLLRRVRDLKEFENTFRPRRDV